VLSAASFPVSFSFALRSPVIQLATSFADAAPPAVATVRSKYSDMLHVEVSVAVS